MSAEQMLKTASCESTFRPNAYNPHDPNSGSYGLFQYQKGTWARFTAELDRKYPGLEVAWDIGNPYHQSLVTAYAFSRGYQTHWSCWKKHYA